MKQPNKVNVVIVRSVAPRETGKRTTGLMRAKLEIADADRSAVGVEEDLSRFCDLFPKTCSISVTHTLQAHREPVSVYAHAALPHSRSPLKADISILSRSRDTPTDRPEFFERYFETILRLHLSCARDTKPPFHAPSRRFALARPHNKIRFFQYAENIGMSNA